MQNHIDALSTLLGDDQLLAGEAIGEKYQVDWSGENPVLPPLVIRPDSTEVISKLLKYCNEHRLAVVTQGGMTGLAGGATPRKNEIALSLERMKGIVELDHQSMTMTVRSGTQLQVIQQAAEAVGLRLPLDLGARGSCQIGGNVATNAGGNQVLSFGMARAMVLGLEAVQADGTVISAHNKMLKNNAGYDLKQLYIGSEGTLGVITEVVLRLFPAPRNKHTALVSAGSFEDIINLLHVAQSGFARLSAFEVMWEDYFQKSVAETDNTSDPFDKKYPYYVLLESENDSIDWFQQVLFDELEKGTILDATIAQSGKDSEQFWAIRDAIGDLLSRIPDPANFDIGLPISRMQAFIEKAQTTLNKQFKDLQTITFGHLADGNIHLTAWSNGSTTSHEIYGHVYELLQAFEGTVTAEHGIGVMKTKYLKLCRSPEELALMSTLKQALDPNNILNPGRVIGDA